jgi:hypothetical protein
MGDTCLAQNFPISRALFVESPPFFGERWGGRVTASLLRAIGTQSSNALPVADDDDLLAAFDRVEEL